MATDIGQYRGVSIKPGDQASIAAQLKAIDASFGNTINNGVTAPIAGGLPNMDTNVLGGNANAPTMPPPVTPTQTPEAFVAGLTPISLAPAGAGVAAQSDTRTALEKRLQDASGKLLGQSAEQIRLESEANIPQQTKDINALNEQITGLKAAFDAKNASTDTNTFGVNAQSTRISAINRQSAVQLGGLSALLMAKQGSLESARAEVDRTLKLEFDPIRQEIENTKMFLDINNQDLSRAEQRQAEATRNALTRELNATNLMESYKKSAFDYLLKNGGTPAQTSAWANATTPQELVDIFGTGFVAGATPKLTNGMPDVVGALQSTIKLSGKSVAKASNAIGVLSTLQGTALSNPEGKFIGASSFFNPAIFGNTRIDPEKRAEFIRTQANFSGIEGAVQTWLTGASVGPDQRKFVQDLVPKRTDSDFRIREKINNLTNYMQRQAQGDLAAFGINYDPIPVDYFATPVDNYINSALEEVTNPYDNYLQSLYGQ